MTQPTADQDLAKTIDFILEVDRLKSVYRQSPLLDGSRRENSAEHSWHMALMALVLSKHANRPVNVARVVELLLLHDLVEIDAGDVFLYDDQGAEHKAANEQRAADRLFGLLPAPLGDQLKAGWLEFEDGDSAEARFARALDRFQPLLINFYSGGGTWKQPGVNYERVLAKKSVIGDGAESLWTHGKRLLRQAVDTGLLRTDAGSGGERPAVSPSFARQAAHDAEPGLRATLQTMERRYGIVLPTLVTFSGAQLDALHNRPFHPTHDESRVEVASFGDRRIATEIRRLGDLSRVPEQTAQTREAYKAVLLDVYRALPIDVERLLASDDVFVVAPRREGYLLADSLGWLPAGRHVAPHVKRVKHEGGLAVGHDLTAPPSRYRIGVLVDGALASGVSLMAMMVELAPKVDEFVVLAVHATGASINAIRRTAATLKRRVTIHAGDVSGELNDLFYAVQPGGPASAVIVGDLGDMIAGKVELA
ncbi:HD domain-containing protein [Burkholderia alba]|uniref:HD domain-containing protein n=1 Tax=Burkholderia alba TaxID=2683677 RepID=UPI002B057D0C|nr:HD domain-containing protein [Burkholderia alba]